MKYLLDANIWLDLLLNRAGHDETKLLLATVPNRLLVTTDFALHAVGIYVTKRRPEVFSQFIDDLIRNEIGVVHLPPTALGDVVRMMNDLALSFDDAFQYLAAESFQIRLVSFDADFDRTPAGCLTPARAIEQWKAEQKQP